MRIFACCFVLFIFRGVVLFVSAFYQFVFFLCFFVWLVIIDVVLFVGHFFTIVSVNVVARSVNKMGDNFLFVFSDENILLKKGFLLVKLIESSRFE